jgi:hypothetical protein
MTDHFLIAYIDAALWSSTDNSTLQGGDPLDANYTMADLAPETLETMRADCARFARENAADIAEGTAGRDFTVDERAGHDFWLTRNRHGAGFWDGDWPEAVGARLTAAAHAFGEVNLYVGDDDKIYQ